MPNSFFHKVAGIIPGFNGYMDRERRRDADKILRTYLAHQYSAQRDRLTRAQQSLLRAGQLNGLSEVERLAGVLQRFIDRLSTATYGYSGLFDPVKIEAQDLDQLYAFDMALTSGVDEVSSAIGAIESSMTAESARTDVPAALSQLSSVLDDLNLRLNQRSDLLTTGRGLPQSEYTSLVDSMSGPTGAANSAAAAATSPSTSAPPTGAPSMGTPPQYATGTPTTSTGTSTGAPTVDTSGQGEMARYPGGSNMGAGAGTAMPGGSDIPPYPTGGMDTGAGTSTGSDTTDLRDSASGQDYGINTASSPTTGPTGQGSDIAGDLPTGGVMDSSSSMDANDATDMPDAPGQKAQM